MSSYASCIVALQWFRFKYLTKSLFHLVICILGLMPYWRSWSRESSEIIIEHKRYVESLRWLTWLAGWSVFFASKCLSSDTFSLLIEGSVFMHLDFFGSFLGIHKTSSPEADTIFLVTVKELQRRIMLDKN